MPKEEFSKEPREEKEEKEDLKETEKDKAKEKILGFVPEDLRDKISLVKEGENIKVVINSFLGKENFNRLAEGMRDVGGRYVHVGKTGNHFLVKVEK